MEFDCERADLPHGAEEMATADTIAVISADWMGATLRGPQVAHVPWSDLRAAAYQADRTLRAAYARAYIGALVLVAGEAVEHFRREPAMSRVLGCMQRNLRRDDARRHAERSIAHARAEMDAWRETECRLVEDHHAVADRIAAGDLTTQAASDVARARERRGVSVATAWLDERMHALEAMAAIGGVG